MFFLRILRGVPGQLDLVQISDDRFTFLLEIEGRRPAVDWLMRQGCCPGAAHCLYDAAYGQAYNINSPADAADAGGQPR